MANIQLYGIRNGHEMSTTAVASYVRNEMANFLRSRVCSSFFFFCHISIIIFFFFTFKLTKKFQFI